MCDQARSTSGASIHFSRLFLLSDVTLTCSSGAFAPEWSTLSWKCNYFIQSVKRRIYDAVFSGHTADINKSSTAPLLGSISRIREQGSMIPKADSVICVFLLATANAVHILAAGGLVQLVVSYRPSSHIHSFSFSVSAL